MGDDVNERVANFHDLVEGAAWQQLAARSRDLQNMSDSSH